MTNDIMTEPRLRILEFLKRNGTHTIDELVYMMGLSKTATRAHLTKLEDAGYIVRVRPTSQSVGRPPLTYTITRDGGRIFPSDDVTLLTDLLDFMSESNEHLIETFFQRLWDDRRTEFEEQTKGGDLELRRLTLERLLEKTRFMPDITTEETEDGAEVIIRECNCPFPAAVRATRIPCQMEQAFLEDALGGTCVEAELAKSRSEVCTFRIRLAG